MKSKVLIIALILSALSLDIFPQTLYRNGLFLHHSSGGVIWTSSNPNVPGLINQYNTEHNYTGNFAVNMNMEPDFFPSLNNGGNYYDAWHAVFVGQSAYPQEDSLLQQYIQSNKIIVIKVCWGGSAIAPMGNPADTLVIDDETSATGRTYFRTQWHWRSMLRVMQNHPDRFFVIWTGIPLNPGPSYNGTIAHNFFLWAKDTLATGNDPVFGAFPNNVYIFDAFHLLAVPTQTTQWGTAIWGMNPLYHDQGDNHPNSAGANAVAHPFIWETFDAAIAYEQGGAATFPLSVNISAGWNMVSIPGLLPSNQSVSSWWPGKDPNAGVFKFQGGYQTVTAAEPGKGYWMKNLTSQTYNTGDEWPAQGINLVSHSPVQGYAGWNMFGVYNQVVNTGSLTTTPPGLISGTIYKYTPGAGYQLATQLIPGYAYWVKLSAAGMIIIPTDGEAADVSSR